MHESPLNLSWNLMQLISFHVYEYTLVFCKTEAHGNGDARSRLLLLEAPAQTQNPPELILLMDHLKESPVTYVLIAVLYITQAVKQGWPVQCPPRMYKLAPFAENKL